MHSSTFAGILPLWYCGHACGNWHLKFLMITHDLFLKFLLLEWSSGIRLSLEQYLQSSPSISILIFLNLLTQLDDWIASFISELNNMPSDPRHIVFMYSVRLLVACPMHHQIFMVKFPFDIIINILRIMSLISVSWF
jgi:hypothetical protein